MQPPDITRVFKGARNEFEVEIVFAQEANKSPKEGHTYDEIIVVTNGVIELERAIGKGQKPIQSTITSFCQRIPCTRSLLKRFPLS
jgi:hypothetical protein